MAWADVLAGSEEGVGVLGCLQAVVIPHHAYDLVGLAPATPCTVATVDLLPVTWHTPTRSLKHAL